MMILSTATGADFPGMMDAIAFKDVDSLSALYMYLLPLNRSHFRLKQKRTCFHSGLVRITALPRSHKWIWLTDVSRKVTFPERHFPDKRFRPSNFSVRHFRRSLQWLFGIVLISWIWGGGSFAAGKRHGKENGRTKGIEGYGWGEEGLVPREKNEKSVHVATTLYIIQRLRTLLILCRIIRVMLV